MVMIAQILKKNMSLLFMGNKITKMDRITQSLSLRILKINQKKVLTKLKEGKEDLKKKNKDMKL